MHALLGIGDRSGARPRGEALMSATAQSDPDAKSAREGFRQAPAEEGYV
jgi:hypothetical protein